MAPPDGRVPDGASPPLRMAQILTREIWIGAVCGAILCGLAWWWLWRMSMPMPMPAMPVAANGAMEGMAGTPPMTASPHAWSLAYLGPAFLMWAIMMIAMMLPSASPMILLHAAFGRRSPASARGATAAFALTYLLLWAGFAVLAALGQAFLVQRGLLAEADLKFGSQRLAAMLLAAAALYQLSGLKRMCLSWCRSPVGFLMQHWRPGVTGAIRMGIAHGLYCIGCCSVLMLLLFVGGVMNFAWIAFLTVLVLVEKYAPEWLHANWLISVALLIASAALLLR